MQAQEVVRLLPEMFRRTDEDGSPFAALMEAMAGLLDPADRRLTRLDDWFSPYRAPTAMLPFLARWVDLAWLGNGGDAGIPPDRLRELIARAPELSRTRGTVRGLELMLRTVTGVAGIRVLDQALAAEVRPFHLVIELPPEAGALRPLVELVAREEKPAHLSAEIVTVDQAP